MPADAADPSASFVSQPWSGLRPAQLVGDPLSAETVELQWFLDDGGPLRQLRVDLLGGEDLSRCRRGDEPRGQVDGVAEVVTVDGHDRAVAETGADLQSRFVCPRMIDQGKRRLRQALRGRA